MILNLNECIINVLIQLKRLNQISHPHHNESQDKNTHNLNNNYKPSLKSISLNFQSVTIMDLQFTCYQFQVC